MLVEGFITHFLNAWHNLDSALDEVLESCRQDRINRAALNKDGFALGSIGANPKYIVHAWQLHPLVVHPVHHGSGIGRNLLDDLEAIVHLWGGTTIYLGKYSDDSIPSQANNDLNPDVFQHIT